jgi:hypothetical protein
MHPTLSRADRVEELLQGQPDDSPYDYKSLFPTDGYWARRRSQKKLAFLKRIDEPLRAMLWPGERVVFLTSGVLYSFWESYFLGLPMYYLNRRALILTNERLILLQIDSRRRPRELRSQVPLRAIEELSRTGLGNTKIRLQAGGTYTIAYVPRQDRKSLVSHTEALRSRATRASAAEAIEHLCPHCYAVLADHPVTCSFCGGGLKSSTKAGLLSLLFPGLGDIYIGHWRFAVLEMAVAAIVWLGVIIPDPDAPMTASGRLTVAAFAFVFMHGVDAIGTRHVARKGHYPSGGPVRTRAISARAGA